VNVKGEDETTRPGEKLGNSLIWSGAFHVFLAAMFVISAIYSNRGAMWGGGSGGGGAIQVSLVGSLPAIPLPSPTAVTSSRVVDATHGLYKSEPPPKIPYEPKAVQLPRFTKEKRPVYKSPRPSKLLKNKAQPPRNAVPYGQGGAPQAPYSPLTQPQNTQGAAQAPYSTFTMGQSTQGGLNLTGPGGGFGQRFPWYVEAVQRRVSSNWLQATVDPTIQSAPRAVIDFEILRDGTIVNVQVMQSSGYSSVDASAVRAIESSSPLAPLPGGYTGSYVNVEFWFDFHR
jgi:protein TonB